MKLCMMSFALCCITIRARIALIPGQPTYELEPVRDTEFGLKGLSGFSVVFLLDGTTVEKIEVRQPNGVFMAVPQQEE